MLQQTQATRVVPKYLQFLQKFPTINCCIRAGKKEMLEIWSGLGYNKRALWLQESLRQIQNMATFPRDYRILLKLKGIGPYTSRSILVFAFNSDYAAVDTNIKKILIHHKFTTPGAKDSEFQQIADCLLPTGKSRDWHNAMMDYASLNKQVKMIKTTRDNLGSSTFLGSTRHIRGQVIYQLIDADHFTIDELYGKLSKKLNQTHESEWISLHEFKVIISKLAKDGLIEVRDNLVSIT